jgi:hypothetical protein
MKSGSHLGAESQFNERKRSASGAKFLISATRAKRPLRARTIFSGAAEPHIARRHSGILGDRAYGGEHHLDPPGDSVIGRQGDGLAALADSHPSGDLVAQAGTLRS